MSECKHHHLAPVDRRGYLTYTGVGWPPVAGDFCYACQTYLWRDRVELRDKAPAR